jgi:hypothetical protein
VKAGLEAFREHRRQLVCQRCECRSGGLDRGTATLGQDDAELVQQTAHLIGLHDAEPYELRLSAGCCVCPQDIFYVKQ